MPVYYKGYNQGFKGGTSGKDLPANAGDTRDEGLIPGLGRCPEDRNGNSLHILVGKTPWTEEPGRLQSRGLQRVGQN